MNMADFKAGDVVRLKSGGPKMTVEQVGKTSMTGQETVWVSWFDESKKSSDTFVPEALDKI